VQPLPTHQSVQDIQKYAKVIRYQALRSTTETGSSEPEDEAIKAVTDSSHPSPQNKTEKVRRCSGTSVDEPFVNPFQSATSFGSDSDVFQDILLKTSPVVVATTEPPTLRAGPEVATIWLLIKTFGQSSSHQNRLAFIRMCDHFVRELPRPMFELYFLRSLARLSADKVRNVRALWASLMALHVRNGGRLDRNALMVAAAKSLLSADKEDLEVRRILGSITFKPDTELEPADGLDLEDLAPPAVTTFS